MDKDKKKPARVVSIFVFIFMASVSTVIFITKGTLSLFDYILIISAPFLLSAFFYFVVLYHDPNASD